MCLLAFAFLFYHLKYLKTWIEITFLENKAMSKLLQNKIVYYIRINNL